MNPIEEALAGGVGLGTAILFPALGELISERAGVVNLGTEGAMLGGALGSVVVTIETGNVWLGLLVGIICGAAASAIHGWLTIRRKADQLASGLVLWFLVLGMTSTFGADYNNQPVNAMTKVAIPGLSKIPWVGPILFDHEILVYVGYVAVAAIWYVFYRTRAGLALRATGERPDVVATTGGRPQLVQFLAVTIGGAFAGLGGAFFANVVASSWTENLTHGYGFVAVAVVLFAAWRPLWVLGGSFLFGIALNLPYVLQAHQVQLNQALLDALPYLVTLLALAALARRGGADAPEELGKALNRSSA
ncbi:MAG TPA: ABC transporter permease [Jatrophihabitans sp.]|jgi:simple sugar transport system permease protein